MALFAGSQVSDGCPLGYFFFFCVFYCLNLVLNLRSLQQKILYDNKIVIVLVIVLLTGSIQYCITIKVKYPGVLKNNIDLLSFVIET